MSQKLRQDISIGENLRKLRRQSHLTQEQVVTHLQLLGFDISRSSYSQMECGTYNIRISELIALADLFHVDYNTIFENLSLDTPD
jgi:transcriptional regulator with XRE-family HTH domain